MKYELGDKVKIKTVEQLVNEGWELESSEWGEDELGYTGIDKNHIIIGNEVTINDVDNEDDMFEYSVVDSEGKSWWIPEEFIDKKL